MTRNQKGFTHVVALLLALVITVVAGTGYYVWHTQHETKATTTPATTTKSTTAVPSKKSTIPTIPSNKYTLVTYSSISNDFSVLVPKYIYDYYGGCTKQPDSYRPQNKWVPSAVYEVGEAVYITDSYYYQLGGEVDSGGVANFKTCIKAENSFKNTDDRINHTDLNYTPFEVLPLYIGSASNTTDINAFLQRNIWTNYKVAKLTKVSGKDYQEVELGLVNPNDFMGQGRTVIRYYPSKKKVIAWDIGQYNHYVNPSGNNSPDYTGQMIDSFKFN